MTVTVPRLVTQRAWRLYTNAMGWQSGSSGYNFHTGPCIFYRHGPFPTRHKDLIIDIYVYIYTTYIHWSYVIISYHIINACKYWNLNLDSSIDSVNLHRFEALHPISRNFSQKKTYYEIQKSNNVSPPKSYKNVGLFPQTWAQESHKNHSRNHPFWGACPPTRDLH